MSSHRKFRNQMLRLVAHGVAACLVSYFAYYTIEGDRGLKSMTRLQGETAVAEARLDVLQGQGSTLEKQVGRLRTGSLDADLLDERARTVLNFSRPDDLIIRQGK